MQFKKERCFRFPSIMLLALSALFVIGCSSDDILWKQDKTKYLARSRREWNHRVSNWREVANWSFNDNRMPDGFRVYSGEWQVTEGKLCSVAGKPDGDRRIKIANCSWPALRLEFDAVLQPRKGTRDDRIGDIGISFNADPATGSFAKGYAFITAQYFDQVTVLYRLNIPIARTEWSPIEPGQKHHVVVEVVKPHLRLWIDGRVVLGGWERRGKMSKDIRDFSDFLDMEPEKVITLHTYDTVMQVDNLRILVPEEN